MAKLLLDEHPLLISPTLAAKIGLNEAIMLQQINYWISDKRAPEREGRRWHYETYPKWQQQFPFWSLPTIKRIALSLESLGFVITKQFNQLKGNMTKWYSIDYDKYHAFIEGTHGINLIPSTDQIDPINGSKRSHVYSKETTEETNKDNNNTPPTPILKPIISPVVVSSEEEKTAAQLSKVGFKQPDAIDLVREFGVKKVTEKLKMMTSLKDSPDSPVGWLISACRRDFVPPVAVDDQDKFRKAAAASIEAQKKKQEEVEERRKQQPPNPEAKKAAWKATFDNLPPEMKGLVKKIISA